MTDDFSLPINRGNDDNSISFVHLGDLLFGLADRLSGEQVGRSLLTTLQEIVPEPDICLLSGDFSNRANPEEFEQAGGWLSELCSTWKNTRFFLVPGNHDVTREKAVAHRATTQTMAAYAANRTQLAQSGHLDSFTAWHQNIKRELNGRIVSDWSQPMACASEIEVRGHRIGLLGLNTAFASCGSDEENLVQDTEALANLSFSDKKSFVIAVGHHGLNWLAPWNRPLVEHALRVDFTADIYLHGHRHTQSMERPRQQSGFLSMGTGAAYADARWPQFFSQNAVDYAGRLLLNRAFLYSRGSRKWKLVPGTETSTPLQGRVGSPKIISGTTPDADGDPLRAASTPSDLAPAHVEEPQADLSAVQNSYEAILQRRLASSGMPKKEALKHTAAVAAMFGNLSMYIDHVDRLLPASDPETTLPESASGDIVNQTSKSIVSLFDPNRILASIGDLPQDVAKRARDAINLWEIADASRQMGGKRDSYRAAAEALAELSSPPILAALDTAAAGQLQEMATMERAYMLLCAGDVLDLLGAQQIYFEAVNAQPRDPLRNMRLGQVYLELKDYERAAKSLSTAISATAASYSTASDDKDIDGDETPAVRMHEYSQLGLALCKFREFSNVAGTPASRRGALKIAVEIAFAVSERGRSQRTRDQAVNDAVYYAWEERELLRGSRHPSTITNDQFEDLGKRLEKRLLQSHSMKDFREADTLLRVYGTLGKRAKEKNWAEKVCLLIERIAEERTREIPQFPDRFGDAWMARVMPCLEHTDEKESLIYAQRALILLKLGYNTHQR